MVSEVHEQADKETNKQTDTLIIAILRFVVRKGQSDQSTGADS